MKKKFYFFIDVLLLMIFTEGTFIYLNSIRVHTPMFGWRDLISNLVGFLLYILAAHYFFIKYKTKIIDAKSPKDYWFLILYNKPYSLKTWLLGIPKNWSPLIAVGSVGYITCMLLLKTIRIFEWILIFMDNSSTRTYFSFRRTLPYDSLYLWVALPAAFAAYYIWRHAEYKKSKKALSENQIKQEVLP